MFNKERKMVQQTSDFINNMVHEFQTPISNIRFAANLIKKKEQTFVDEKISEYVSVIIKENQKLEKNVEEILKVSCTSNDNSAFEETNIHQIINTTTKEFSTRIESLNGQLKIELLAETFTIIAAPDHLKLIFSNLIDNAIKYSVGAPKISISTKSSSEAIHIKIKDNGIGIDKAEFAKICEKYYRVSTGDVHDVKGFGLGLTYVKKLIEQYKGKIIVSSTKGIGSVFTISLPLKK